MLGRKVGVHATNQQGANSNSKTGRRFRKPGSLMSARDATRSKSCMQHRKFLFVEDQQLEILRGFRKIWAGLV